MKLTHINSQGRAKMVDVSLKDETLREAVAKATVVMKKETIMTIKNGGIKKGDILSVAQVAGIMAAKKTPDIIPMCHPIFISGCNIEFEMDLENAIIDIYASAKTFSRTGIEMEALCAASTAALTIYDMCKAIDRGMIIREVKLIRKSGGKSGEYENSEERRDKRE